MAENMNILNDASQLPGYAVSNVGLGVTFDTLLNAQAGSQLGAFNQEHIVPVDNMTQVEPKVQVADGRLQSILKDTYIGAYPNEYEAPHITIRMPDRRDARLLLSTGELMNKDTKVDKDIIKAVQADMRKDPNKYIQNWNVNNPDHAVPLKKEQQNELPKKDESWKEAAWYKEAQAILAAPEED